jgi:molybdenum cofactor synthesis domain-containing protein
MIKATIITIGDEILIGQIVDTNSVSIAKHLNTAGITVHEKISIGDTAQQIEQTLSRALAQSEVVILTGGLGPTKDDITKFTLAKIFSSAVLINIMLSIDVFVIIMSGAQFCISHLVTISLVKSSPPSLGDMYKASFFLG